MSAIPSEFFESINAVLAVMFFWVIVWFAYDIIYVYRDFGRNIWAVYRETAASIACLIAFTGDLIVRGAVWNLRNRYGETPAPQEAEQLTILIIAVGVMISIVGCSCIIVHLSPRRLGAWPWVLAVLSALIFCIVT